MKAEGFDTCPECGENAVPRVDTDSQANAVACQKCGWVFGLLPAGSNPRRVSGPLSAPGSSPSVRRLNPDTGILEEL